MRREDLEERLDTEVTVIKNGKILLEKGEYCLLFQERAEV